MNGLDFLIYAAGAAGVFWILKFPIKIAWEILRDSNIGHR